MDTLIVISSGLISASLVYLLVNVTLVLQRNHRAHKFFAQREPKLPVLPAPSLFHGHMCSVMWKGKNWQMLEEFHQAYGATFGLYSCDEPWVCTTDLDLIKLIYIDKSHKHINRPAFAIPFKEFKNSIFQVQDDKWRRVRRAVAPALTNHKVRSEEISSDIESILVQLEAGIDYRMRGQKSVILHADDMFARYTLAVILLITYKRANMIDFRAERDEFVEMMDNSARTIENPMLMGSVMFPFVRPLFEKLIGLHPMGRMRSRVVSYIIEATQLNRSAREQYEKESEEQQERKPFSELMHMANGFKRRLVDTFIDALVDKRIGYEEFIGSTFFLLLAGFQTTADSITCLVWQLARHPEIQEKLRASLASEGLESEYLNWCVQENLRFHPAVPLGTGRVLGEDLHFKGLTLPKGTYVQPTTHAIHHDPSIWPEPERFWPERWQHLDKHSQHPAAFMGFGLGPRNCVGSKLALHEIKLVVRMLLSKYRIEKCPETPEKYDFTAAGLVYTSTVAPIKVCLVAL